LATYDRCVAALAGRLGAAPSIETQALAAALRRGGAVEANGAVGPVPATRAGVRVGVAPLRAVAGGDKLAGLSLGLAEEITSALARFRWLFLIATPSMAAVARGGGEAGWRDLALDFLLDGTLQQSGTRVRVNLRLMDMRAEAEAGAGQPAGEVVWSARYEREADDLLTLQDEIAAEAVAQIDPQLIQHESRRAGQRAGSAGVAANPTAYDLVLRAIPALYQLEEREFLAAGRALERAVALDPGSAAAHAWLAYWHIFLVGQGWNAAAEPPIARGAAMARAGTLAERAVRLDPADAQALTIAGHVRAFLHRDVDGAMELHDRALGLNPNLPLAWAFSGLAESYRGRHAEAIRRIAQARKLSPFDPNAFYYDTALMVPHLMLRHFTEVVEMGRRAVALNPTLSSTYKLLLSALGHLGARDEAAGVRERLYALEPGYSLTQAAARSTFRQAADEVLFLEGLRLAGLPT
jgi:TolB-like protein